MGTGETGTPTKAAKVSTTQEQQTTPAPYPEWGAAAFQAYYTSGGPQPPPGYFPPSVGSGPQPHPYMWGGQPMMPGYGTPGPPYGAMYPHGGMYSHPSLPPGAHPYQYGMPSQGGAIASEATATTPAGAEAEGTKVADRLKNRLPSKRSKGSDGGKGNSGSADGVFSQSGEGESGSEGSSEGSEDDNSQSMLRQRSFEQMTLEGAIVVSGGGPPAYNAQQAGGAFVNLAVGQTGAPGGQFGMPGKGSGGSATNLAAMNSGKKGKRPSAGSSGGMLPTTPGTPLKGSTGRDGVPPELWLQDEREVKRQRRKQSNRESARRSRLRKQAECEELGTRVDTLTVENMALRNELTRVSEECKKYKTENAAMVAQLKKANANNGTNEGGEDAQTVQTEGNGKAQDGSPRRNPSRNEEASGDSPTKAPASIDAGTTPTTEPAAAVAAG